MSRQDDDRPIAGRLKDLIPRHVTTEQLAALMADFRAGKLVAPDEERPGGDHGPSVKCPSVYDALIAKGFTKSEAAAISNAMYNKGYCDG